jgi:hypothetical protein
MKKTRISKKVVRYTEEPEVIPDCGRNLDPLTLSRKRKAGWLEMDSGEESQHVSGWSWCAVM